MQKLIFRNANGVEIDLTTSPYGITEWEGLAGADLNIQTQQVPFQDGAVFLDALIDQREIAITLAIKDDNNLATRYELRRELISVLNPKLGEGVLIYTNDFISKQIHCIPQIPIFENHNSNDSGTPKASLVFSCPSPYWEDLEETTVELPTSTPIENNGDVPCQIKAVLNAGASNPVLFNKANNKEIGLSGVFEYDVEVNTNYGEKGIQTDNIGYQWVSGGDFLSCCYGAGKLVFAGVVNMIQELFTGKTYAFDVGTGIRVEKIRYINNMFYALSGGYVCRSKDGINWSSSKIVQSQNLFDIIYANNQYVVVGGSGNIFTSPDGTIWTSQTSGVSATLRGVVFANNKFVSVGTTGTILTSENGTSWTSRTSGTNNNLNGITFANDIFVAVGLRTILTSTDGTTWTTQTAPSYEFGKVGSAVGKIFAFTSFGGTNFESVDGTTWTQSSVSGNVKDFMSVYNIYYRCGEGGSLLYSEDFENWTRIGGGITADLNDITYAEGLFVACGQNKIVTSEDGKVWTTHILGEIGLNSVAYGNGKFIAVSNGGGWVYSSTDGETWSSVRLTVTYDYYRIRYVNNTFIIAGNFGTIITSPDGETWTIRTSGVDASLRGIAYGNNMYIVGGGNYILTSTDLETWTSYSLPMRVGGCYSLAFANGKFVLGSANWGAVCTSVDGQTWIFQYEPPDHNGSVFVEYLNNMFVCVCGGWKYIITSTDGTNLDFSENLVSGFSAVAYGQDKLVVVGTSGLIYNSYIAGKKNIVADLTPESDMTFNLEQGENEIIYLTDGNTQATLSYRQKYIGV